MSGGEYSELFMGLTRELNVAIGSDDNIPIGLVVVGRRPVRRNCQARLDCPSQNMKKHY